MPVLPRLRAALAGCLLLGAGCSVADGPSPQRRPESDERLPAAESWAPNPVRAQGLTTVATADAGGFALHLRRGDVSFLPGVNLGATTPGHHPGELAIAAEDYRRWFALMGELGVRAVRVYTIHPPGFYAELADYNEQHPDAPLYLVQGVYLPDESYLQTQDLWADRTTDGFHAELRDASAAVHGDLRRGPTPGRASGTWTSDVSPWLAGWIVGVEWDPAATLATDRRSSDAPAHQGRYFRSTAEATPTERWLAAAMDELAAAEAARGSSAPVAFVNWPTTDPLRHPAEPLEHEDLVGIDANHVVATPAWPGGTFASYHAYPYYPDFLRYEERLRRTRYAGRPDPYAGYLAALRDHHDPLPVMVTEFGVPSSLGVAHSGPLGRDQGGHTEAEAMRIDAELMRLIRDQGMSGAFVFAWTDEWFKLTWNTVEHQVPAERRPLWHDPLTNEQHFGLVATDALGAADARRVTILPEQAGLGPVTAQPDEAYLHLRIGLPGRAPRGSLTVGVDTLDGVGAVPPSGSGSAASDHAFVLDLEDRSGQAFVRSELDPVRFDGAGPPPPGRGGWNPQRLVTNRSYVVDGRRLPVEYADVGRLRHGVLDPTSPAYDNLATWHLRDEEVHLRIPWAMAGLSDPSSRQALAPGATPSAVPVDRLGVSVALGGRTWQTTGVTWQPWDTVRYRERLKHGAGVLARAFRGLSG